MNFTTKEPKPEDIPVLVWVESHYETGSMALYASREDIYATQAPIRLNSDGTFTRLQLGEAAEKMGFKTNRDGRIVERTETT